MRLLLLHQSNFKHKKRQEMKDQKKLWEWMKLFEDGVELECYSAIANDFVEIPTVHQLTEYFKEGFEIRIKPQPKKVVLYGSFVDGFAGWQDGKDTHTLTFEIDENNKPILGTEKLEEIK